MENHCTILAVGIAYIVRPETMVKGRIHGKFHNDFLYQWLV